MHGRRGWKKRYIQREALIVRWVVLTHSPENDKVIRTKITIEGIVQGVGFRPFIYNLAKSHNLKGYVLNNPQGVQIEALKEKAY